MSLTSALSNAGSGLAVAARSAELVATNVANSLTEGYGRREIQLTTSNLGGDTVGVRVAGVDRVVDQVAITQRRLSESEFAGAQSQADFFRSMESLFGTPDQPNSLSALISNLESELVLGAATPSSTPQLTSIISAAQNLTELINDGASGIQELREQADREISGDVETLNDALQNIHELNSRIGVQASTGGDVAGLMDQRQSLIDQISPLVPMREIARENGRIALVTTNGTILLDDKPAKFEFTPTYTITPELSVAEGTLSGLTIVGAGSSVGSAADAISGGGLSAKFSVRDDLAVQSQVDLDNFARELIEKTSDPRVDPSLAGGPGLFSDSDSAFDALNSVGLAERISVNSAILSEPWKLRDGAGVALPGPSGDPTILSALSSALSGNPEFASNERSVFSDAVEIVSNSGSQRSQFEKREAFFGSQVLSFQTTERMSGVDTDQEMQKLLSIEQAYAANARVIQTIDELMQTLLRL